MNTDTLPHPSQAAIAALAPTGILRAGINLSNFLLVTGKDDNDDPTGVSPDLAATLAAELEVDLELVSFKSPGELADAATDDVWDIGNIGAEPKRAEHIAFTAAYCEIESTYLVPAGSPLTSIDQVDQPGIRIASAARAAYDLWLERNLKHAELVQTDGLGGSFDLFVAENLDALAGLRPGLLKEVEKLPGSTILDGYFSTVQQAVGTPRDRDPAGAAYLVEFVEAAKATGLIAELIVSHEVVGLSVAPAASSS